MAYRAVQTWEILDVLRRIGRGEPKAAVARATGHTRRTIRSYVAAARANGWEPGEHEPDEPLALMVYRAIRPGPRTSEPGAAETKLLPHRGEIAKWLEHAHAPALRLTKIHGLLVEQGVTVSYASLRRFVIEHCGFRARSRAPRPVEP